SSQSNGDFRACGLSPGRYRVTATDGRKLTGSVEFSIADSDVHDIKVDIDPVRLRLDIAWEGDPPSEGPLLPNFYSFGKVGNSWAAFSKDGRVLPDALPPGLLKGLQSSEVGEGVSNSFRTTDSLRRALDGLTPRDIRLHLIGADNQDDASFRV